MAKRLRVGVLGVGPLWRKHYQRALPKLRGRLEVRAFCDQIWQRAVSEARRSGCEAVAGPTELLQRGDIDALLVLDRQWFGLWPVELACRLGKPVLCASWLEHDEANAERLRDLALRSGVPVMMGTTQRLTPATARLAELLRTDLGPPRLVLVDRTHSANSRDAVQGLERSPITSLLGPSGSSLLDYAAWILGGEPISVRADGLENPGFSAVYLEFGNGSAAQVRRLRASGGTRGGIRIQVIAERGSAVLDLPNQISWDGPAGRHSQSLSGPHSSAHGLLASFWQTVHRKAEAVPSIRDAYRALVWLRAAVQSAREDRSLRLGE